LGARIFGGRSRAVDFNQIPARVLFSATGCRKDDDFRFARQWMIRSGDDDFNARPSPNWGISLLAGQGFRVALASDKRSLEAAPESTTSG
jgi:hypothetical protein